MQLTALRAAADAKTLAVREDHDSVSDPHENARRFERLKAHLESVTSWLELSIDDSTLVVDVGELELKGAEYGRQVDKLLAIPPTPEHRDELASQIASIWAAAGAIKMVCEDLEGPLDRLCGALCEENDDDRSNDS